MALVCRKKQYMVARLGIIVQAKNQLLSTTKLCYN